MRLSIKRELVGSFCLELLMWKPVNLSILPQDAQFYPFEVSSNSPDISVTSDDTGLTDNKSVSYCA